MHRLSRPAKRTPRRGLALALTVVAFSQCLVSALQAQQKPNEYQVKAAYLYNFGKFVTWSATNGDADRFAICILGKDPFGRSSMPLSRTKPSAAKALQPGVSPKCRKPRAAASFSLVLLKTIN